MAAPATPGGNRRAHLQHGDPAHEEHERYRQWAGGDFSPEAFISPPRTPRSSASAISSLDANPHCQLEGLTQPATQPQTGRVTRTSAEGYYKIVKLGRMGFELGFQRSG